MHKARHPGRYVSNCFTRYQGEVIKIASVHFLLKSTVESISRIEKIQLTNLS